MSEQEPIQPQLEHDPRVTKVLQNLGFQEGFSGRLMSSETAPLGGTETHNPEFEARMHFEQVRERMEELVRSVGSFDELVQAVRAEAEGMPDPESRTTWFEVLQQLGD